MVAGGKMVSNRVYHDNLKFIEINLSNRGKNRCVVLWILPAYIWTNASFLYDTSRSKELIQEQLNIEGEIFSFCASYIWKET